MMKNNILLRKLLLSLMLLSWVMILFSSFSSSVTAEIITLGTFKQGNCVNLKQICANCTFVNITSVIYPNSSIASTNISMTKSGTDYNATFCKTNDFGEYIVNGFGDPNSLNTIFNYNFYINGIGSEINSAQSLLYFILIGGIAVVLIFTIIGAIMIKWQNPRDDDGYIIGINDLKYMKVVLWIFVYLEVLFLIFILRNISGGYLTTEGTYSFFNLIFNIMLIGLLPMFPLVIFFTAVIWISDKKTLKAISRGIPI